MVLRLRSLQQTSHMATCTAKTPPRESEKIATVEAVAAQALECKPLHVEVHGAGVG
jgi:hypothetical protein